MLSAYPVDTTALTAIPAALGAFKEKRNFRRENGNFIDEGPMLDEDGRQVFSIDVILGDGRELDRTIVLAPVEGATAIKSLNDKVELEGLAVAATARDGRASAKLTATMARVIPATPKSAPASSAKQQRLTDI